MKNSYLVCLVLSVLSHTIAQAQRDSITYTTQSLADINLRFELPSGTWSKPELTKTKSQSQIYTYTRKLSIANKKSGKATLSILVEKVKPSTSIKEYSMKNMAFFERQNGFKITKAFTSSDGRFDLPYTVGYEAEYIDANGLKHHLYILHTIEFNHAAQWLMDFPYAVHEIYEEEQTRIIKSLRYERF
jgi:hypothetical protein